MVLIIVKYITHPNHEKYHHHRRRRHRHHNNNNNNNNNSWSILKPPGAGPELLDLDQQIQP